jgi:hypothetical protein
MMLYTASKFLTEAPNGSVLPPKLQYFFLRER